MKLSIIIVNYNTKELLRRCLKSLPDEWGVVIVVDNSSTDESVEMIKKEFPSVRLILNSQNLGFARAVNQALRQAIGEAVLLLNSDTIVKKGALEKLIEFEKKVRPAIIGAKMLNPDGTVQGSCFYLPTISRAIKEYWFGKSGYFSKYAPEGKEPMEVEAVSGGAMLISKGVIEKIGLFDERYFMYFEDLDYCRKARKVGYNIYYLPTVEIVHEHGASGKNLAISEEQWKRLIPSSKVYHGPLKHFLINLIIRLGQL